MTPNSKRSPKSVELGAEAAVAADTITSHRPGWKTLAPIMVIGLALIAFFALGLDRYFTIEALRENRAFLQTQVENNLVLSLIVFVAAYAAVTAISFPGASALTIFGGFLFGLWVGTAAVIVAATAGALVIFTAARTSLGDELRKRAGAFMSRMEGGFRENELSYMFLVRLVPIFPFWAINIAAGLMNMRPRNFVIGTLFGMIPGSFVYVSIGHGLGSVFDAGGDVSLSGVLFRPETIIPILGLAALAAAPIAFKVLRRRRN